MEELPQLACRLETPLYADSVDSPIVQYSSKMTAVHFTADDGCWGRVTFERLDSIKVSRGECDPFPFAPGEEYHWATTISNSRWLRERYEYEKLYYGKAYNFGGDVNEMLDEYSHYVFSFHDEFVEAIAAGIWFESADTMLGDRPLDPAHPLNGLANLEPVERFESSGIVCVVRRNPLPQDEIERAARLCSQVILEVGADIDDRSKSGLDTDASRHRGSRKNLFAGLFWECR